MNDGAPQTRLSPEVALIVVWVVITAVLDRIVLESVPETPLAWALMSVPMVLGLGVLLFMLGRNSLTMAERNRKLVVAEQQASQVAAELEAVLASITDPMIVTDGEGRLTRVNQALAGQMGQEWLGQTPEAIHRTGGANGPFHEDGSLFAPGELPHERALAGRTVENETLVFKHKEGLPAYYLASSSPIREPQGGAVVGSVTLLRDISSLKRLERLKDEFLFTVSHELRTPLAVIRGYAELSLSTRQSARCSKAAEEGDETSNLALRRILGEVDQMAALLEQMLQIARIDAGRVAISLADFDLVELTKTEVSLMSVTPGFARVVVDLEKSKTPVVCALDRIAYRQVLRNLISNALKYSPAASPVVVRVEARDGAGVVSVIDYGCGIPEDELPLIFEKFYRAQSASHSGTPGLGLGLYITSRLVELMRSRITVQSRPGQGTTFAVAFPASGR